MIKINEEQDFTELFKIEKKFDSQEAYIVIDAFTKCEELISHISNNLLLNKIFLEIGKQY